MGQIRTDRAGIEPATYRLTAGRSAAELTVLD